MANTIVLGMQWGDEGKGKIVDLVCPAFDAVVRFQGGNNAGHTVKFGDRHFALHFLPSGILFESMQCVLANGMVLEPGAFFGELDKLTATGIDASGRLFISDRAQVILPTHLALDAARESGAGKGKIGTTVRGIGPAYESKMARSGVRVGDLASRHLDDRLAAHLAHVGPQLAALDAEVPAVGELASACRAWGERLAPFVRDTAMLVNRWIDTGKSVLFEGAQGTLLDIDHGTYPYVTSSSAVAGGVTTGAGVPPTRIDGVLGVVKAYTTRVGAGPFVSELLDATGEHLRQRGNEFGTTTGRPRRCGWFDAVVARHARILNGVDVLALTKLDVLDEIDEIEICTGYRHGDTILRELPGRLDVLEDVEPVYRTVPGWKSSTQGILAFEDLPRAARDYVAVIQEEVGAPVGLISTGPRREETIVVEQSRLRRLLSERLDRVVAHRGAGGGT